MVRTFICVEINNPDVIDQLGSIINTINFSGVRVVKLSQLHLTLKFLGEVPNPRISTIKEAIERIDEPQFEIELKSMGCFPNPNYIRVVWIGISKGNEQLMQITQTVEELLTPMGFPKEKRKYSPHLTLARIKALNNTDKNTLQKFIRDSKGKSYGIQLIDKVILKKSTLTPSGPIYEDLLVVPLKNQ
ncbi:MAG: RNA 2',3'-cyclic phosphodiesterase [Candidatus Hermodarchaeota archaeon]